MWLPAAAHFRGLVACGLLVTGTALTAFRARAAAVFCLLCMCKYRRVQMKIKQYGSTGHLPFTSSKNEQVARHRKTDSLDFLVWETVYACYYQPYNINGVITSYIINSTYVARSNYAIFTILDFYCTTPSFLKDES